MSIARSIFGGIGNLFAGLVIVVLTSPFWMLMTAVFSLFGMLAAYMIGFPETSLWFPVTIGSVVALCWVVTGFALKDGWF